MTLMDPDTFTADEWRQRAACLDVAPEVMLDRAHGKEAAEVCADCDVRADCRVDTREWLDHIGVDLRKTMVGTCAGEAPAFWRGQRRYGDGPVRPISGLAFTVTCRDCGADCTLREVDKMSGRALAGTVECSECRSVWSIEVRMDRAGKRVR